MDLVLLSKTIVGAGLIVVFLVEVIKRQIKKSKAKPAEVLTDQNKDKLKTFEIWHIPSWLGLSLGAALSLIISLLFFKAWLQPASVWVYLIHTIAIFLFQYFVSMELAKRILSWFSKRQGVDISPIVAGGN